MAAKPNPIVIQPASGWSYNNISYALDDPDTNYDGKSYYQGNLSSPYNISCGHASHGLSGTDNYYSNYRVIAVKGTTASDSDDWYLWHDGETYSVTGGANIRTNGKTGVTLNFDSSGGKLYFTANDTITVNTTSSGIVQVEGTSGTINTTSASKFDLSAGSNITFNTGSINNKITLN